MVLRRTNPDFTSRFLNFINIPEHYLVDTLLHNYSQTLYSTGSWGAQIQMKSINFFVYFNAYFTYFAFLE